MKVAVVGHVEWIEFAQVSGCRPPARSWHAHRLVGGGRRRRRRWRRWQLAKLAGERCLLHCAWQRRAGATVEALELEHRHARVEAFFRDDRPQRRGFTFLDARASARSRRSTTATGRAARTRCRGHEFESVDSVYFVSGDAEALRAARGGTRARGHRALPAHPGRRGRTAGCARAQQQGRGRALRRRPARPTAAARRRHRRLERRHLDGGRWAQRPFRRRAAAGAGGRQLRRRGQLRRPLTFALQADSSPKRASRVAARCGAATIAGRGPYGNQLGAADL